MKNKILYGVVSATDQHGFRADELLGMSFESGTALVLHNEGMGDLEGGNVTLTVTDGKMKEVCKAIADEINYGTKGFVVLADEVDGVYLHSDITACASTSL
jgi:limonene-1,2-epoxide hydrolase